MGCLIPCAEAKATYAAMTYKLAGVLVAVVVAVAWAIPPWPDAALELTTHALPLQRATSLDPRDTWQRLTCDG